MYGRNGKRKQKESGRPLKNCFPKGLPEAAQPALYVLDIQCGMTPNYCYLGGMKNTENSAQAKVKDLAGTDREQIKKWLGNDLKRIQALMGMLQDPVLNDALVHHIEGMMTNEENRKRVAERKEDLNG